jgi:tRNA_anti-like
VKLFLEKVILVILVGIILSTHGPNYFHFNWPLRIATATVSLIGAGLISWTLRNNKEAPSTTVEEVKAVLKPAQAVRAFIPLKPQDLVKIYRENTEIQADKLAAMYINNWMRLEGTVTNVYEISDGKLSISLRTDDCSQSNWFMVHLSFEGKEWFDRVKLLPRGHRAIVDGQLRKFSAHNVNYENCELVETDPK